MIKPKTNITIGASSPAILSAFLKFLDAALDLLSINLFRIFQFFVKDAAKLRTGYQIGLITRPVANGGVIWLLWPLVERDSRRPATPDRMSPLFGDTIFAAVLQWVDLLEGIWVFRGDKRMIAILVVQLPPTAV